MSNFLQAARHTDKENHLPHQDAAWNYAWDCLTLEERKEFLSIFRAAVPSKTEDVANSWQGIMEAAAAAGSRYPELVAAQWALESGWGKHQTGRNNFWGIKTKGEGTVKTTKEFINGKEVTIEATFRDFPTIRNGVHYLVDRWYKDWEGKYKGVNRAADREAAADMLISERYATDPAYASKLKALMAQHAPRPVPTQEAVKAEAQIWRTKVQALNLSQPDAQTCQAACIAMAVGNRDIMGIRAKLKAKGTAGDPAVMGAVIKGFPKINYLYDGNASLEKCISWLKAGELLITHGWFTRSGHVLLLDGLQVRPDGSVLFDVKDPWSEFDGPSWSYKSSSRFFDGYYSERIIFAACVEGSSVTSAEQIYKAGAVDRKRAGMWVHRFKPE